MIRLNRQVRLAAALAVLAAAGLPLGPHLARAAEPIRVGVIYLDAQGYYAGVRKGVESGATAAARPVKLIETTAQDDPSKESGFVDTLTAANVQAILLSAVSAQGSVHTVRRAHEAGIPVVCYNTCVEQDAAKRFVSAYVVGDPVKFGADLGNAAAEYFHKKEIASPKIAIVNCEFVEVCIDRRKGFLDALHATLPGATVVDNQQGTTEDVSFSVVQRMLSAHPDIQAFFGESGGATIGAVRAIGGRHGEIAVFGSDMTTPIATALAEGSVLKAVVDISGQAVGRLAIAEALSAIDQHRLSGDQIVQAPITLYAGPDAAKAWLAAHADGLP